MPDGIDPISGPPVRLPVSVCRSQPELGEVRASGSGTARTMEGHFSAFGNFYEINSSFEGHFMERVAPGAFRKTFQDNAARKNPGNGIKVLLEHGHDPTVADKPLGVPKVLEEDGQGARYEVDLLDTSYVRDLIPALEAGAYGSSFRFKVMVDEWDEAPETSEHNPKGIPERTIKEVRVMEFGPTMYPANGEATAGLRSTTDEYYAGLKRRQPEAFADALRSATETREQAEQARAQAAAERARKACSCAVGTLCYCPGCPCPGTVGLSADHRERGGELVTAGFTQAQVIAILERQDTGDEADPAAIVAELQRLQAEEQGTEIPYHADHSGTPAAGAASTPNGAAPSTTGEPQNQHSTGVTSGSGTNRSGSMPVENQPAGGTGGELTMTVEERQARQGDIQRRLNELDTEYNGAALPQERQQEWDTLSAEYDEHTGHIAAAVARQQRIAVLSGAGSSEGGTPFNGAPAFNQRRDTADIYDLTAIRRDARSMDDMIARTRENALRAIEQHHYDNAPDQDAVRARIDHLLRTVDKRDGDLARRILVTGTELYDRAFGKACLALNTHGLTNEERAALAVGTTTAGGFAVPFSLDPTVIMTNNSVVNPVRSVARVVTITGKQWQGITSAGISVARAAEAAEASDNAPTIAQPTATPTRVQGFVPFSFEVDQDWTQMRSELGMMFDEAKDVEESTAFTTGSGVDPNPEGFITGIRANAGSLVGLTTPGSLVVADIYKPVNALPPRHVANASWMGNKGMYNLVRQLDTAGGANLWARLAEGRPARLIDYPLAEASAMANGSDLTTANTSLLVLGDFKKFLIVDRVGMSVELIPHLFGATNRFPTGQRGLYAVWRNTSKVLDPNAFRLLETS